MSRRAARDPLVRRRAVDEAELMDDPECDPVALELTFTLFSPVNALLSGWRGIYRRRLRAVIRRAVADRGRATLLDIGSGGGDVARALARRAARDGLPLDVLAIDPDPRAHAHALAAGRGAPGVTYRCAHSAELVRDGESFDIVISNHLLHHLDDAGLRWLLADTEALCAALAVHNDLRRSRPAWLAWWVLTLPLVRSRSFLRYDGLLSIRRSRTVMELAAEAPAGWRAHAQVPFRALLARRA